MNKSVRSLIRKIILENDSHLDVFDPSISSKEERYDNMVSLAASEIINRRYSDYELSDACFSYYLPFMMKEMNKSRNDFELDVRKFLNSSRR